MCTSDSDDGMVKNSGMASCENRSHRGSEAGGRECVCVCVLAGKLLALMLRIKVPVLPVKNDITPTGGRPNSSRSSVFPAGIFRGSLNEYS